MREIKFRAWDKSDKEFIYSEGDTFFSFWKWVDYDSDTPVMQYTGLKDKNGEEIYEGDIVQFKSEEVKENFEVRWDEDWAGFRIDASYLATWNLDLIEVVGNIYENPKLLSKLNKEKK